MSHELTASGLFRSRLQTPLPSLRPVVAASVALLALLSLLDIGLAYANRAMPPMHLVAVPIAVGVMVAIWFIELAGLQWPRLLFVALVTIPNLWLAVIGHNSLNYLFLLATVGWVSYRGSRTESLICLAANLAVVAVGGALVAAHGDFQPAAWIPWALGLVLVWMMNRALLSQQRLMEENALLYEQAQQAALLEERQRLARELHDAVTQTLFSSSLIADVLPRIWESNPAEGQRRLDELRQLTRGALAEMRTLLNELRPAALTATPLEDLLRQLAEASSGQTRSHVGVEVTGSGALPPDVQIAFYRIAQEALNNVAKHANGSNVLVSLEYQEDGGVELRVRDDGQGFDPSRIPAGHMGVGIMRERAAVAGLELQISSDAAAGTCITVSWYPGGDTGGDG